MKCGVAYHSSALNMIQYHFVHSRHITSYPFHIMAMIMTHISWSNHDPLIITSFIRWYYHHVMSIKIIGILLCQRVRGTKFRIYIYILYTGTPKSDFIPKKKSQSPGRGSDQHPRSIRVPRPQSAYHVTPIEHVVSCHVSYHIISCHCIFVIASDFHIYNIMT